MCNRIIFRSAIIRIVSLFVPLAVSVVIGIHISIWYCVTRCNGEEKENWKLAIVVIILYSLLEIIICLLNKLVNKQMIRRKNKMNSKANQ